MPDDAHTIQQLPASTQRGPVASRPLFEARFGPFAAIVVTNSLLSLPTLGFYRFWGKTRLRRYLWSHISYLDGALEYSGRASELLIGFLIALLVLLPLVLIPVGIGLANLDPTFSRAVEVTQTIVFIYLIHVAVYRARRYRLSRTQWRGIRGGQSGSSWSYAVKAMAWGLLAVLSLGLTYALYRTRLQEIRTKNTWFGDRQLAFEGRAGALFGTWFVAWLLLVPTLGLSYVWYRVREFRYFASVTRLGRLSFRSELEAGTPIVLVIFLVVVMALVVAVILGGGGALLVSLGLVSGIEQAGTAQIEALGPVAGAINVIMFLLIVVAYAMARTLLLLYPLTGAICRSLTILGEEDFAAIAQSQQARPGRGEGLADSLDVGDF